MSLHESDLGSEISESQTKPVVKTNSSKIITKSILRQQRKSIFELQGKDKQKKSPVKTDDKDKIIEPRSRTFNKLKERI